MPRRAEDFKSGRNDPAETEWLSPNRLEKRVCEVSGRRGWWGLGVVWDRCVPVLYPRCQAAGRRADAPMFFRAERFGPLSKLNGISKRSYCPWSGL